MRPAQPPPPWPVGSIVRGFAGDPLRIVAVASYNEAKRRGIALTGFFDVGDRDRPFYLLQRVGQEHEPTESSYDTTWRTLMAQVAPGRSVHAAYFADTIGKLIRLAVPNDNEVDE